MAKSKNHTSHNQSNVISLTHHLFDQIKSNTATESLDRRSSDIRHLKALTPSSLEI
ncbi:60S ribosomal protein [Schistosoma japonicum]|uniref:60S ribosomal protein n=1 Tax=Schistosoma japonicum TaxID=6182 RepID=A0A4Z2DLT4_SCHJA|nr:60S ribosomal protein [Schistosoma japonicum]